jgi:hypothetical protein
MGHVSTRPRESVRDTLTAEYPELSGQAVSVALEQAIRAATMLTGGNAPTASTAEGLVAALARNRLDAMRERQATAARRVQHFARRFPMDRGNT